MRVTAHLLHALACIGSGARTRAVAPVGVSAPAVYGPMVTMLAAYLAAQHHIPVARIVEILADLAGIDVSPGWVMTAGTPHGRGGRPRQRGHQRRDRRRGCRAP